MFNIRRLILLNRTGYHDGPQSHRLPVKVIDKNQVKKWLGDSTVQSPCSGGLGGVHATDRV
jgi:hypothetical protein